MSRDSEARAALKAQCAKAIQDIENQPGRHDCKAHDAIGRGLVTLLRCQVVRMDEDYHITRRTALIFGTAAGAAVAAVWSIAKRMFTF